MEEECLVEREKKTVEIRRFLVLFTEIRVNYFQLRKYVSAEDGGNEVF